MDTKGRMTDTNPEEIYVDNSTVGGAHLVSVASVCSLSVCMCVP